MNLKYLELPFFNIDLSMTAYLLIFLCGLCGALSLIFKAIAFQHEEASKLTILHYLYVVMMLIFDVVIFETIFTHSEIIGILIIFGASVISTIINFRKH